MSEQLKDRTKEYLVKAVLPYYDKKRFPQLALAALITILPILSACNPFANKETKNTNKQQLQSELLTIDQSLIQNKNYEKISNLKIGAKDFYQTLNNLNIQQAIEQPKNYCTFEHNNQHYLIYKGSSKCQVTYKGVQAHDTFSQNLLSYIIKPVQAQDTDANQILINGLPITSWTQLVGAEWEKLQKVGVEKAEQVKNSIDENQVVQNIKKTLEELKDSTVNYFSFNVNRTEKELLKKLEEEQKKEKANQSIKTPDLKTPAEVTQTLVSIVNNPDSKPEFVQKIKDNFKLLEIEYLDSQSGKKQKVYYLTYSMPSIYHINSENKIYINGLEVAQNLHFQYNLSFNDFHQLTSSLAITKYYIPNDYISPQKYILAKDLNDKILPGKELDVVAFNERGGGNLPSPEAVLTKDLSSNRLFIHKGVKLTINNATNSLLVMDFDTELTITGNTKDTKAVYIDSENSAVSQQKVSERRLANIDKLKNFFATNLKSDSELTKLNQEELATLAKSRAELGVKVAFYNDQIEKAMTRFAFGAYEKGNKAIDKYTDEEIENVTTTLLDEVGILSDDQLPESLKTSYKQLSNDFLKRARAELKYKDSSLFEQSLLQFTVGFPMVMSTFSKVDNNNVGCELVPTTKAVGKADIGSYVITGKDTCTNTVNFILGFPSDLYLNTQKDNPAYEKIKLDTENAIPLYKQAQRATDIALGIKDVIGFFRRPVQIQSNFVNRNIPENLPAAYKQLNKWIKQNIDPEIEIVGKKYPELKEALYHVVRGEPDANSGLHHFNTLKKYMDNGLIIVRDGNTKEILTNTNTVKNMLDNGENITFKFVGKPYEISADKTFFPSNWTIEDIALAGEMVRSKGENVLDSNRVVGKQLEVEIRGKKRTVFMPIRPDGRIPTWFVKE